MSVEASEAITRPKGLWLLLTLFVSMFLTATVSAFSSTLLLNIAASFKVSIGTASQLGLVADITGLFTGFGMSGFAIKVKHKLLFLLGIVFFASGIAGFFLAQIFGVALLSQFFIGAGTAMISIMTYSLIGEHFSLEKRGWAMGLIVSTFGAAYVIVAPLSGIISNVAGWRAVLLWLILPISVICLILSLFAIPSKSPQHESASKSLYARALKEIFLDKSAIACVTATSLLAFIGVIPVFAVSFYRTAFAVSTTVGGTFSSIAAGGATLGAISGGRLINRCGRKSLAITAGLVSGISSAVFAYIPNMLLSVVFWLAAAISGSVATSALLSLVLEQVSSFKASIMSINSIFQSTGLILGIAAGGIILNVYHSNYQLLMMFLGVMGLASCIILLFAKDPCKSH